MLTDEIKQKFDETRKKLNDCIGFDQYGSNNPDDKLYIINVSDDYQTITVSNGRKYYYANCEANMYRFFPEEQYGDWDIIIFSAYDDDDDCDFMHGS